MAKQQQKPNPFDGSMNARLVEKYRKQAKKLAQDVLGNPPDGYAHFIWEGIPFCKIGATGRRVIVENLRALNRIDEIVFRTSRFTTEACEPCVGFKASLGLEMTVNTAHIIWQGVPLCGLTDQQDKDLVEQINRDTSLRNLPTLETDRTKTTICTKCILKKSSQFYNVVNTRKIKPKTPKAKKPFLSGYKTYDPDVEGYGNPSEWRGAAARKSSSPAAKPSAPVVKPEEQTETIKRAISFDDEE